MAKRSAVKQLNNVHPISSDEDNEEPTEFKQASEEVLRTRKIKPLKKKGNGTVTAPLSSGFQFGSSGGLGFQSPGISAPNANNHESNLSEHDTNFVSKLKALNASFVAMLQKYPIEDYSTVCQEYIRYRKDIIEKFNSASTKESKTPVFSIGNEAGGKVRESNPVAPSIPSFSFGVAQGNPLQQKNVGFGAEAGQNSGFGVSSDNTNTPAKATSPNKQESIPTGFSFGATTASSPSLNSITPKGTFTFGVPATGAQETQPVKPGFSFGIAPIPSSHSIPSAQPLFKPELSSNPKPVSPVREDPSKQTLITDGEKSAVEAPKSQFSFGSGVGEGPKSESQKPVFAFGAKALSSNEDSKSKSQPAFTFGNKPPSPKKDDTKPTFTLGSALTTNKTEEPAKPKFEFGSNTDTSKPAFTFGTNPVSETKPTFTFGTLSETNKQTDIVKPAFSFGSNTDTSKPAFTFGAKPISPTKDGPKPAFSFASAPLNAPKTADVNTAPSLNGNSSAPKFTFGMSAAPPLSNSLFSTPVNLSKPDTEGDGDGEEEDIPQEPQLGIHY
jgi:hypothetical protein